MVSSKILTPSFIIEDCTGRKTLLTHQFDKDIDPPWTNCDSRYHHHRSTYLITDADLVKVYRVFLVETVGITVGILSEMLANKPFK